MCVGGGDGNIFEGGGGGGGVGVGVEYFYPITTYMISGRRGGVEFFYYLPFLPPPHTHLIGTALTVILSKSKR